jgi:hypothetical protein
MAVNPFLKLAEQQMPAPVKAKLEAAARRISKAEQKREEEKGKLSRLYQLARKQELDDALAGPDGDTLRAFMAQLGELTLESIPTITAFVRAGGLRAVSADNLFLALRHTSEAVVKLRTKSGLAPFDDPLPGEPATPDQDLRDAFADHLPQNELFHEYSS